MFSIDLRSDTLTRPSPGMLKAMATAEVGDDAYGEDRYVIELQEFCADYFGKAAALFMPSGTMANQVALRSLTQPGDEVICDASYHINFFESAQSADLGRVTLNPIYTADGILTLDNLANAVHSKARWNDTYASPTLVWVENTVSTHAGKIFPLVTLEALSDWCQEAAMSLFIDGARILNACVGANIQPAKYASAADALTMCFSKGLGAPFGSILMGGKDFIARARRYRKWFGGGLHQSGFMAAAALYAIKNNVEQLMEDHKNAALLAGILRQEPRFSVKEGETNMIVFDVGALNMTASEFVQQAAAENVLLMEWRANEVRAVTSSNVNRELIVQAGHRLVNLAKRLAVGSTRMLENQTKVALLTQAGELNELRTG